MPPSLLHRAARNGDAPAVATHLADDPDPRTACGWTPLADAAWAGHAAVVAQLLAAAASPRAGTVDGLTPLMLAAGQGHKSVVAQLLAVGAEVDARSPAGRSALESALQRRHVSVARMLTDAGAPPGQGAVVLWVRALAGLEGRRCKLLPSREAATGRWVWATDGPIALGDDDLRRFGPLVHGVRRDGARLRAFDLADSVRVESRPGAFSPEEPGDGLPSGRWRVREGWTEHAEAVLHRELRPDQPDRRGFLASWSAVVHDAAPALADLLGAGAAVDALPAQGRMRGATLLLNAAHLGHSACVEVLLEAGAALDQATPAGWTPLMAAAAEGHTDAVHALIRAGADLTPRNAQGQTALSLAQARGHAAAARSLLVAQNAHHLRRQGSPSEE